jgi:hypothetical protein
LTEAGNIGDDSKASFPSSAAAGNNVERGEHGIVFVVKLTKSPKKEYQPERRQRGSGTAGMLKLLKDRRLRCRRSFEQERDGTDEEGQYQKYLFIVAEPFRS